MPGLLRAKLLSLNYMLKLIYQLAKIIYIMDKLSQDLQWAIAQRTMECFIDWIKASGAEFSETIPEALIGSYAQQN